MAINSAVDRSVRSIASKSQSMSVTDVARAILEPLASLKLTVFLLAFSVFVVWVITLEQTRMDFWELKHLHFGNAFVFVPFQSFLPLGLFSSGQGVSGGFWLPSGFVLIVAMLVNLTAAHVLRFRLQAKGLRLALGIAVLAGASFLTWAVIFNGQNSDGFQGQPPISFQHMWIILQIAMFGLCVGSIAGCVTISRDRFVERILLGLFALVLISVLGVTLYFGEKAFIGDSAMRILWQLMQSTLAAATGLAACILLFRRKAGIVLLHIGIAGLLLNEIYVSVTNEEQMLSFVEGETVSHAVDLRSTEMAIIDRSDDQYDRLTVVPGRRLMESRNSGAPIDDPDTPFTIECLEYFQNSSLGAIGPMQLNLANTGIGTSTQAMLIRPSTGTDVDRRSDKASAYVRLKDRKTGQALGDYLLSQQVYENGFVDAVTVDGHDYQIGLRLKHIYKPYDVKLTDVEATYYPGTKTARWFSSDIELSNFEDGMSSKQRVWMNNPLRYGDETFYQTRYDKTSSGQEVSSLQVVKNRGWMIPYVCCMLVVTGLIAQLGSTLLSFLQKISSPQPNKALPILPAGSANSGESDRSYRKGWFWAWLPTIVLVGAFGYYAISQLAGASLATVDKEGMKLELLGQVPVIYQGRVQPMDSLARNVARQLSKRELVVDRLGNKQPAIRWLADSIFEAPGYDQYEIMRVEDINVQNALQLPRRQGLKYTWDEIRGADQKMVELLIEAEKLPEEQWSDFQRRLRELYGKSRKLLTFRTSMRDTSDRCKMPGDDLERLEEASTLVGAFEKMVGQVPLAFPSKTDDASWIPLSTALDRQWLAERAEHYGTQNIDELARKMIREAMIKASIISRLTSNEDFIKVMRDEMGLKDRQEIAQKLSEKWDEMPKALYQSSLPEIEKEIDQLLAKQPSGADDPFSKMMRDVIGEDKDVIDAPVAEYVLPLAKLQQAYLETDAETFNTSLETYLASISKQPPKGFSPTRNHWETSCNEFSPFYLAIVIYLAAFLVTIFSWLFALAGWQQPINRAAFWLVVLGLAIHVGGIVARVVISGRPPVTNLYSSFVFVAALAVVILLVVEIMVRMGIGNLMASLCGFLALMWAWTLSIESGDTYTVLVAVLDTQFWLSTHVISVSIGYGATLAAGMLGLVLLLGSLFTPIFDSRMRKTFGKIIYGVICFALLFSFFGTVLGGLWADDSWGRFWGWDPKENGALMIVLWNAVSLHARWAGIVRERGLAALAVFGNIVTLWSWEGVNQLGVGLHAYSGMTSGASAGSIWMEPMFYLKAFVLLNLFACVVMMIPTRYWFSDAREAKLKAQSA